MVWGLSPLLLAAVVLLTGGGLCRSDVEIFGEMLGRSLPCWVASWVSFGFCLKRGSRGELMSWGSGSPCPSDLRVVCCSLHCNLVFGVTCSWC